MRQGVNQDEYNLLFHKLELNRVAFVPLVNCDHEVLKLVNAAVNAELDTCAELVELRGIEGFGTLAIAAEIRARKSKE
jgi:hypothetical protein